MPRGVYPRTKNQLEAAKINLAKGRTKEVRDRVRLKLKENAEDPEWRQMVSDVTKAAMHRPDIRTKHLEGLGNHFGYNLVGPNPKAPKFPRSNLLAVTQEYVDRFWARVDIQGENDCWVYKQGNSYGMFWNGIEEVLSNRFVLELKLGRTLHSDEWALHTCDNPPCVNPNHLFLGNHDLNTADMVAKGRQSRKGHLSYYDVRLIGRLSTSGWSPQEIADDMDRSLRCIESVIEEMRWNLV